MALARQSPCDARHRCGDERIRGRVSSAILDKANRLFRNDDAGVWVELLQNARRAGANSVDVEIAEVGDMCRITVADNGSGIQNFQSLLTLGESEWISDHGSLGVRLTAISPRTWRI